MSGSMIDGMDDQQLDKATQEARENISREIAQTIPLIGERTPLQSLVRDFSDSVMFQNQIKVSRPFLYRFARSFRFLEKVTQPL